MIGLLTYGSLHSKTDGLALTQRREPGPHVPVRLSGMGRDKLTRVLNPAGELRGSGIRFFRSDNLVECMRALSVREGYMGEDMAPVGVYLAARRMLKLPMYADDMRDIRAHGRMVRKLTRELDAVCKRHALEAVIFAAYDSRTHALGVDALLPFTAYRDDMLKALAARPTLLKRTQGYLRLCDPTTFDALERDIMRCS